MAKLNLLHWLLPSVISVFLVTFSAEAARLESWRFEPRQNRLSFTTQGGVQPQAQLLSNPTRLVIDLPGTTLGSVSRQQPGGGAIREIRTGQFDSTTARIVVELVDGYTIDPQQVKFRGVSPSEWIVQIPDPQRVAGASNPPSSPVPRNSRPTPPTPPRTVPNQAQTLLDRVEVRQEGIVLHTSGKLPQIEFKRGQDGSWMTVDILGASLSPESSRTRQQPNRDGAAVTQVTQLSTSPPVVRVTLSTSDRRQQWQARASSGGVAIWPQGKTPPAIQVAGSFATIKSVELRDQNYFVVQADQPLNYSHGWDSETGAYSITFFSAKLADNIRLPQREVGGPLLWTRVRQDDRETFTLLFQPATRVKIGQPSQTSSSELAFPIGTNLAAIPPVPSAPNPGDTRTASGDSGDSPRPLLPPRPNTSGRRPLTFPLPPVNSPQPYPAPARRDGRVLIVIDPGHGGSDVGAVGVGGLREKDVVFPISQQVAQILEQNGVQVILTRQNDFTVELEPRVDLANRFNADLFVSIHANAATRREASGVETFYYQSGYSLAQYIQNSILANFRMENRGVKQARFFVLRNTAMPSALVEIGFVSNDYDASILADPTQQSRMAQAIAQGILQYLQAAGYR
ncbi:MAG: N-acetylmuramoyl-L-alanine amidase [Oscillatoriales cyanobacterium RM2_1_1]|nr:N-acetylmuramoyl-L-alanine amidase [Oscillatoriales cyanobacterium SM2_3_0]NJO45481.1 N-acetylmuramoyl-L-alanine amidase [Oscillatoriales cyanobacterium RM2_1_1]